MPTSVAGSSASSSLSNVAPQARTLSSALGVAAPTRTMSIEMADVSGLSLEQRESTDEERIREKAREAQEQVCRHLG